MGKKHKKHKSDRHFYEGEERLACLRSRAVPCPQGPDPRRSPPAGRRSTRACRSRRGFVGRWEVGRPPSAGPGSAPRPALVSEYVEKPLKLVLKVGGSEVTELSTGSSGHDSSLFEDRSDHDKHKDRKRKKRKKGEKQAPGEEKGRKRRRVKVKGALLLMAPGSSSQPP